MTAAFIIRFHYEPEDPRFAWRFQYFRDAVLPRILAQGEGFDIAIWCNAAHRALFLELSDRIRVFDVRGTRAEYRPGTRFFFDFAPWEDVIGLPKYELQLGIDSDDLIMPGYLEHVRAAIELEGARYVCFQPELIAVEGGLVKSMPAYTDRRGSAFFALYQPAGTEPYIFAYSESHLTIGQNFPPETRRVMPAGFAYASCHELNESTHL